MKSNRDPLLLNLAYSHDSEITHGCLSHQILLRAVDFEKTQMLDNFLANNYDVDSNDGELLLRAIRSKRQKMVEYLLGKGAKPLLYFGSLNPKKCGCGDKGILLACWNTLKAEEQETIHSSIRQSLIDHHGIPAATEEKSTDIISIGNGAVVKKVLVYPENVLQAVQNGDWDALYKHYAGDYQKMFQVIEDNANLVEYKMQNPNQKKEFLKHLAEEGNIFVMVAFFEPNKKALQDKPGSKFVPFQGGPALHDSLKIAVERNDIAVVEFLLSKRGREYEVNFNELLKLAQKNEEMTQVLQRDISKM
jgi:ankyrin repeat protein